MLWMFNFGLYIAVIFGALLVYAANCAAAAYMQYFDYILLSLYTLLPQRAQYSRDSPRPEPENG